MLWKPTRNGFVVQRCRFPQLQRMRSGSSPAMHELELGNRCLHAPGPPPEQAMHKRSHQRFYRQHQLQETRNEPIVSTLLRAVGAGLGDQEAVSERPPFIDDICCCEWQFLAILYVG